MLDNAPLYHQVNALQGADLRPTHAVDLGQLAGLDDGDHGLLRSQGLHRLEAGGADGGQEAGYTAQDSSEGEGAH